MSNPSFLTHEQKQCYAVVNEAANVAFLKYLRELLGLARANGDESLLHRLEWEKAVLGGMYTVGFFEGVKWYVNLPEDIKRRLREA
jgi:hypothetical protein